MFKLYQLLSNGNCCLFFEFSWLFTMIASKIPNFDLGFAKAIMFDG